MLGSIVEELIHEKVDNKTHKCENEIVCSHGVSDGGLMIGGLLDLG